MDVTGLGAAASAASLEGSRKSYDAFISYAHGADGPFAAVVQRGLQHLAKPWNRRRVIEVFRDETSLTVSPGYGPVSGPRWMHRAGLSWWPHPKHRAVAEPGNLIPQPGGDLGSGHGLRTGGEHPRYPMGEGVAAWDLSAE